MLIRRSYGVPDAHGNPTLVDASPVPILCLAQQYTESDDRADADATTSLWWVYTYPDVAVDANDRVAFPGGVVLEVAGPPRYPVVPGEGPHHCEIPCRMVQG